MGRMVRERETELRDSFFGADRIVTSTQRRSYSRYLYHRVCVSVCARLFKFKLVILQLDGRTLTGGLTSVSVSFEILLVSFFFLFVSVNSALTRAIKAGCCDESVMTVFLLYVRADSIHVCMY